MDESQSRNFDGRAAAARAYDAGAFERLYSLTLEIARAMWRREPKGHTLQPTAVASEVLLRLKDRDVHGCENGIALRKLVGAATRNFLLDYAKRRNGAARGGDHTRHPLDEALLADALAVVEQRAGARIEELDAALDALALRWPVQSEIVQLRFFGGLSAKEVGERLQMSPRQVENQWKLARAWLRRRLHADVPRD